MFLLLCYGFFFFFTIFFSDAAGTEYSYLFEIPVEHSIFECNIQKRVPRSLKLKGNIMLKNTELKIFTQDSYLS